MFEMAADYVKFNTQFEVMGGYMSPVSDAYKKAGLEAAHHRLRMCEIAVQQTSNWLMVDPWEALQSTYTRTAAVLDHIDHEINVVQGGVEDVNGVKRPVRIALLAGADLIETMVCASAGATKTNISVNPSIVNSRRLVAIRSFPHLRPLRHVHCRAYRH